MEVARAQVAVSRLNVVYLYVRDMARSVAFYRDLLGIPLEGDDTWAEAQLGGSRFALHRLHEGIGEPSSGTIRLDFEVEDIEAAASSLRAAGAEVGDTMHEDWGTAVEVRDPDGYLVHLFQPGRGG